MAYKRITLLDIWEIIRRRHDKQSISHIAKVLGCDWKTVKKIIQQAQEQGLDFEQPLPPKEYVLNLFQDAAVEHQRPPPAQELLQPFLSEISEFVNDKPHSLKPKIAFEVICQRDDLSGKGTCRMEVDAGQEIQPDGIM